MTEARSYSVGMNDPDARGTDCKNNIRSVNLSPTYSSEDDKSEISTGTAWVSEYGYVVTNHHVVDKKQKIRLIRQNGSEIDAFVFERRGSSHSAGGMGNEFLC